MNNTWIAAAFTVMFAGALASGAARADNEGHAIGVDPDATARGGSGERTLIVGSDVSVGERVVTGPSGQVQLVFLDNTRLLVGPGSSLLIESYLLRGNGSAEKFAINALGGTFRFITGSSAKSAYDIRTPSATIGVRGTEFDLVVSGNETRLMLYDGAVNVCADGGCVDLDQRCGVATVSGAARLYLRADPERLPLARVFRYAAVQSPLLPQFRVSGAGQCLEAVEEGPPGSLQTTESNDASPQQRTQQGGGQQP